MAELPETDGGFPHRGKDDWRLLVEASLGGKPVDAITRRTDDGFVIGPIDPASSAAPIAARPGGQAWTAIQPIDHPDPCDSRRQIAEELNGGAGGVALVLAESAAARRSGFGIERAESLADFITFPSAHLRLETGGAHHDSCRSFIGRVATLSLAFDPLAEAAARGGFDTPSAEAEEEIAATAKAMGAAGQSGSALVADGRVWAAGGASEAQELGAILGSLAYGARILTQAGLTAAAALQRLAITLDAGPNQIVTIAKIRAARLALARFVEAFGLRPFPVHLHAETSWRMMTRAGPHTNIVRTASATLAAGVGGADSITVLPFTLPLGLADPFARRVARNSQIILLEESGLARVGDPAAGAGTIEKLTGALAARAWEIFRTNEARGGLLASLRGGAFQAEIAAMRQSRTDRIARREMPITGVSQFPTLTEAKVAVLAPRPLEPGRPAPRVESFPPVPAQRLSEPFEALRDHAAALRSAGKPPGILIVGVGDAASVREAAQTTRDFCAAGGIEAIDGGGFETPEPAATAFAASGLRLACLVDAEDGSPQRGAAFGTALKARGARRVLAVGGMVGDGIDAVIGERTDMTALLGDLLAACEA